MVERLTALQTTSSGGSGGEQNRLRNYLLTRWWHAFCIPPFIFNSCQVVWKELFKRILSLRTTFLDDNHSNKIHISFVKVFFGFGFGFFPLQISTKPLGIMSNSGIKAEFSWHPYDPLAALKDMGCFKFSCSIIPHETDKTRQLNSSPGYKLNYHSFLWLYTGHEGEKWITQRYN